MYGGGHDVRPLLGCTKMIKAVLFDMDGVLAFTEGFYRQRRENYLAEHGIYFDKFPDATGDSDASIWKKLIPHKKKRALLKKQYQVYAAEHPTPWKKLLNPDVPQTFKQLYSLGMKLGIASSSPRPLINEFVENAEIGCYLSFMLSGDECTAFKPAPDIYLKCMQKLEVKAQETVIIEDSSIGICAGKAAGAHVIALRTEEVSEHEQVDAELSINHLSDMVQLVLDGSFG